MFFLFGCSYKGKWNAGQGSKSCEIHILHPMWKTILKQYTRSENV